MPAVAQEAEKQLDTLETLSCKNLKQVLAEHNVGFEGVVEKEELIRLARRALTDLIGATEVEDGDGAGAKDSEEGEGTREGGEEGTKQEEAVPVARE